MQAARDRLAEEAGAAADPTSFQEPLKLYDDALLELKRANEARIQAERFKRTALESPALMQELQQMLAQPPAAANPRSTLDSELAAIEAELAEAEAERSAASDSVSALESEVAQRVGRLSEIATELTAARSELGEGEAALAATSDVSGLTALDAARRAFLQARSVALEARIQALESERDSFGARGSLLPLLRDRAVRREAQARALAGKLQELAAERRQVEAEAAASRAEGLSQAFDARILRDIAQQNEEWATESAGSPGRASLIAEASRYQRQLDQKREQLAELVKNFRDLREKVTVGGRTEVVARELRDQYEMLPEAGELRRERRTLATTMAEASFRWIEFRALEEAWSDVGVQLQKVQADLEAEVGSERAAELEPQTRSLLTARVELLDVLQRDSLSVKESLVELDETLIQLVDVTTHYRSFIEENILWVRSVFPERMPSLVDTRDALLWLAGFGALERTAAGGADSTSAEGPGGAAGGVPRKSSVPVLVAGLLKSAGVLRTPSALGLVLAVLVLGLGRRFAGQRREVLAKAVGNFRTDRFLLTLRVSALTLFLALFWPLATWVLGWLLTRPDDQFENLQALGEGLRATGWMLFPIAILRQVVAEKGLASVHFRWRREAVASVRKNLNWILPFLMPLAVLALTFESSARRFNNSAGRIAFCAALIAFAVFSRRVLRPDGPVISDYLKSNAGQWIDRLRGIWYGLAVGLPLVYLVVALSGYYYTAFQLHVRLVETFAFVLAVVLLNALLQRWLFIVRRRLSVEQARQRARSKLEADATAEGTVDEDHVDIPAVDAQTRQLFRAAIFVSVVAGMSWIWSDVLPALRALDRVVIWPEVGLREAPHVEFEELEPSAKPGLATGDSRAVSAGEESEANTSGLPATVASLPGEVTLADLGLVIVLLALVFVAARNVPGLLEMLVLQHLPFDSGSRYAITSIVRYLILIFGLSWALSAVGIGWAKVQWLVAALTFGLGFGLQEIFANFVSGLIILAERPIRIGDIVTIGGIEGKVARIRMRATVIVDYDRRELLVPNREFITNELINWTLSDTTSRLVIRVGVAYGSNTRRTRELLLRAAKDSGLALNDPAPSVVFMAFGESSLDFELRIFIASRDVWADAMNDLHMRVDDLFREEEIEIAFPQRDIHVRSVQGLAGLGAPERAGTPASPDTPEEGLA